MKVSFIKAFIIFLNIIFIEGTHAQDSRSFEIPRSGIHEIKSEVLGRAYDVFIQLPRGYHENIQQYYPVIYSNDGPYPFQIAAGVMRLAAPGKAILVGVSFAKNEDGMSSRVRDLTPVQNKSWVKYQTGGAKKYFQFLEAEVISFVEENYRTNSTRIFTGQSLGGSFGTWVLLTKPELFSHYILTSPSLWFKDNMIFDVEKSYAKENKDLAAKVYFAVGEFETREKGMRNDMVQDLHNFTERLTSRNYESFEMRSEVIKGTTHETTYPVGFIKGLLWFLDDL
ncbi:alpha/beta hydrolase [Kiloniella majae]|uniref:alpha/beta hydrolase n=1 Tax=Kiloniella majae TaxID=1938558 RepID=UPI000A27841F|nr:alpha/beta hydrolase-fold protein [Kiloniella majae]